MTPARRGRPRAVPHRCGHLLAQLFALVDASGESMEAISVRAGVAKDTLSAWRRGLYAPKLANVEAVLGVLGAGLRVETECGGLPRCSTTQHETDNAARG